MFKKSKSSASSSNLQEMDHLIRDEVNHIKGEENLTEIGKGFVFWILLHYFNLDRENAATKIVDSPNDKRVDAFFEDEETLHIVQCKFFEDPTKEIGEKDIAIFKGCVDWLRNPEDVRKLNVDRLYDAALTFSERWDEGANIRLHYFAFGGFKSEATHERVVFNRIDNRIQMEFHDAKDIRTIYWTKSQAENPLAQEKIFMKIVPNEFFKRAGEMPSVVATIQGKELLNIYKTYGDNLFERNIRLYKGARRGSINEGIINTVIDKNERANFWYYNNGLSFVCKEVEVKQRDTDKTHYLEILGPQIINGCQTTVCLSEASQRQKDWQDIPDEVQVLARFIKVSVKEVDRVTLYTNSQNPVSEMQLKSNDPIQVRLQKELKKHSPAYFYSIKEGDWQKIPALEKKGFEDKTIQMSDAAQSIYSFTEDPAFARRYRNKLFSEKYYDTFRKDISVEEIILPWRILQVINQRIAQYRREEFNKLKKEQSFFNEEQAENIRRKEFLIYSNLIILYFIGKLVAKKYGQYTSSTANKLLNKSLESRIEKLFDYIVGVLSFSDKLAPEKNLPRYLKNIDSIKSLYDEIQKQLAVEKARTGSDPLKDMLPEIKI